MRHNARIELHARTAGAGHYFGPIHNEIVIRAISNTIKHLTYFVDGLKNLCGSALRARHRSGVGRSHEAKNHEREGPQCEALGRHTPRTRTSGWIEHLTPGPCDGQAALAIGKRDCVTRASRLFAIAFFLRRVKHFIDGHLIGGPIAATRRANQNTRVNAFAEMFPGDERAARITDVADFESIFAKADALFRNKTWQIRCDDCDPEHGGYYWFPLGQCDTPAKALDCIMQLNERRSSPIVMNSFIDLVEYLFGRGAITDE
jgi:hypothetical protein